MSYLIDLNAAIDALRERRSNYREETSTWTQIGLDILTLRALPAVDPATLTSKSVDDSETANPVVNDHIADVGKMVDPAAIREAAMREAAELTQRGADIFGVRMRNAKDKKEHRDWQSMLFAAVEIKYAILALIGETK